MSISSRSFISLIANILKGFFILTTGILLARGLKPVDYGTFAFLLASFVALRSILEMGTSSAFFSFISKRNRSQKFFCYYVSWLMFQFAASFLFISVMAPDKWIEMMWAGESRERVLIAFVAVFLQQQMWNMIAQVGESQRLTVRVQAISTSVAIVHVGIIIGMFCLDSLTIERVYYFIIVEFIVAGFIAYFFFPVIYSEEMDAPRNVFEEYWKFCLPLIPYTWLAMIVGYTDTRLLHHFGGAVEQAYYSVAAQFAAISVIVTVSVMRVLWKEVAEAHNQDNKERVRYLYNRSSRILFMLSTIISCFFIPWSKEIITLALGEEYIGGAFALMLMLCYPIHQSLGQVNGTMFYALEMTRTYVMIGTVNMIISTITIYFLLAPADAMLPGLGLASIGLALKMIVLQFIGVNFGMWWLARKNKWNYSIDYQLIGIAIFVSIGFAVYYLTKMAISESIQIVIRACIAGTIYISVVGLVLYRIPWLLGISQQELSRLVPDLKQALLSRDQ